MPPVENKTNFFRPFLAVLLPGLPPEATRTRGNKERNKVNDNSYCHEVCNKVVDQYKNYMYMYMY